MISRAARVLGPSQVAVQRTAAGAPWIRAGGQRPGDARRFLSSAPAASALDAEARERLGALRRDFPEGARRCGVVAIKVGMMPIFDEWGVRHAATALLVDECEVVQVKTDATDGYSSLQVGASNKKVSRTKKPELGHFLKHGVAPKYKTTEFRVSEEALLPPGTPLHPKHFVAGQLVDVQGVSKGKGFSGVMKRHNFSGFPASHGASKSHRSGGSIGQTGPGRVWKGKKMAGRMGGAKVTLDNLKVLRVDQRQRLIYVKGAVPGNKGGHVRITDARMGPRFPEGAEPPFPTFFEEEGAEYPVEDAPKAERDPLSFEHRQM